MRFDCAGASGSRVGPSRKSQKNTETAACEPTRSRMTFFNEQVLKMTSKGRPGGCRKHKNEVEVRCGLEASVFLKKGAKREPRGLPNELLLVPFGRLLAYFVDLCVPWGFQAPPPSPLARFRVVLGALLVSCLLFLVVLSPGGCRKS